MRRLMTLGLVSMTAAFALACGDDETSPGTGGTSNAGGSSGNGGGGNGGSGAATNGGAGGTANGGGGNGGTAITGNGGNDTGGSGNDPDAGDGGAEPPCTSCVELRVPVTDNGQDTGFQINLGATPIDLSNAVVTYRMRTLTPNDQLAASPFAQDQDNYSYEARFFQLSAGNGFTSTDAWVDVEHRIVDLAPANIIFTDIPDGGDASDGGGGTPIADPAVFDKSKVIQFGVNVASAGALGANPTTVVVLIDSITFTGVDAVARPNITFDTALDGLVISDFQPQPNSELIHHPAP